MIKRVKAKLIINSNNDAFLEYPVAELTEALHQAIDALATKLNENSLSVRLMDTNGNLAGTFEVSIK